MNLWILIIFSIFAVCFDLLKMVFIWEFKYLDKRMLLTFHFYKLWSMAPPCLYNIVLQYLIQLRNFVPFLWTQIKYFIEQTFIGQNTFSLLLPCLSICNSISEDVHVQKSNALGLHFWICWDIFCKLTLPDVKKFSPTLSFWRDFQS